MVEMTPEHLEAQVEAELQEGEDGEEVVTDFSVRLIEKLAKDNKNKPGEGLDSSKNDVPALPVCPLSLSALLSQGFEEGPARRALRLHQNDTQGALDWLINGGTEGSEAVKTAAVEDGVRMPTTIKRIQKLKAMRRAQQEKVRRKEKNNSEDQEKEKKAKEREAHDNDSDNSEDRRSEPEERKPPPKAKKPPPEAEDLLGFNNPAPQGSSASANVDLLGGFDEPPAPTDFMTEPNRVALPEMRSFDPSMCEMPPLPASVAAGTALPRQTPTDNSLMGLMDVGSGSPKSQGLMSSSGSLAQAFSQPAPAPALGGGGYSNMAGDVSKMAAQAGISPEQLLAAAQQLAAQQQQAQPPLAGMSGLAAGPTMPAMSGMSGMSGMAAMPGPASTAANSALDDLAAFTDSQHQAKPKSSPSSPANAPKKDALDSLDVLADF